MEKLIAQEDFFKKYNTDPKDFEKTLLKWEALESIYADYLTEVLQLESSAINLSNLLMKADNVHSVRYRVKDPEHVIEKIIRKKLEKPEMDITIDTYKEELTDLIGIRALHLFKEEWLPVHELITKTWDLKEKPVANYRMGDPGEYIKNFEEKGCNTKEHKFGYRSVHYIAETKPAKKKYFAEIQVRTIFEEAWSEIDHRIRYPYDKDNPVFGQFLLILNRLAGSADEMGSFILFLKYDLQQRDDKYNKAIGDKDAIINRLEERIKELKLKEPDFKYLTEGLEKLKMPKFEIKMPKFELSDFSWLNNLKLNEPYVFNPSKFGGLITDDGRIIFPSNQSGFISLDKSDNIIIQNNEPPKEEK